MNDSMLILGHGALNPNYCRAIVDMFNTAATTPLESMNEEHGGHIVPLNDADSDRLKYTNESNCTLYTVGPTNPDLSVIMGYIDGILPWSEDFEKISFMQIMKYPEESYMNWHKDDADSGDTGTVIFNLNDDFTGGNFIVDGHILRPFIGNMVAFNNSTTRWHGVEPVQTGDRYVLALWFCRKDDDEYEEDPAEQEGKAIYSGAWSSETHPTNTIKIKGIT